MASGYGLNGGPSRCFPFWQDVLACYIVNTSKEDNSGRAKCIPVLEDYMECLHHRKEILRTKALQHAYREKEKTGFSDEDPEKKRMTASEIRGLGLIGSDKDEDKHITRAPILPSLATNK